MEVMGNAVESYCHQPGERVVAAGRAGEHELALMAEEVTWSLAVCKLLLRGACATHTHGLGRRGSGAHPGLSESLGTRSRAFPLQAQAWDMVPLGIVSSVVSVCQERDKRKVEKWGTSLLLVLRTQGTWCPQGGKVL